MYTIIVTYIICDMHVSYNNIIVRIRDRRFVWIELYCDRFFFQETKLGKKYIHKKRYNYPKPLHVCRRSMVVMVTTDDRRPDTIGFRGTTSAPADGQTANDRRWTGAWEIEREGERLSETESERDGWEKREGERAWKRKEGKMERERDRENRVLCAPRRVKIWRNAARAAICARASPPRAAGGTGSGFIWISCLIDANSIWRFFF